MTPATLTRLAAEELIAHFAPADDRTCLLLLRHAARHPIRGSHEGLTAGLTDEGRADARRLGVTLGSRLAPRLYASPVERCMETAALIAGDRERVESENLLAAAYIADEHVWREEYFADDPRSVTRRYAAGEAIPGFEVLSEATKRLSAWLAGHLHRAHVTVCVTHDLVLVPFLAAAAGITFPDGLWLPYLAGALILPDGNGITVQPTHEALDG